MTNTKKAPNRWLQLAVLVFSASTIYLLPYMRWDYYSAMLEAFQVTNEQLGTMMSLFGLFMMFFYFPGGWLCDKFSNRMIITVGLLATGLAGFLFQTFPAYPIALAISIFWSMSTAMLFWTAMIKMTRSLGTDKEQGKIYGLLEGGRGVASLAISLVVVQVIFRRLGEGVDALRSVILIYSWVTVIAGVLAFIILRDPPKEEKPATAKGEAKKGGTFVQALKNGPVWLITIIFFCTMLFFGAISYVTPYLELLGATAAFTATISMIRTHATKIIGAPIGGFTADKVGTSRTMFVAFLIMAICAGILIFTPISAGMLMPAVAITLVAVVLLSVNRGIYFATLSEAKVPMELTGSAVAIITSFGGSPDAFVYILIGNWLDQNPPEVAYSYIFMLAAASAVVGAITSLVLMRVINKANSTNSVNAKGALDNYS